MWVLLKFYSLPSNWRYNRATLLIWLILKWWLYIQIECIFFISIGNDIRFLCDCIDVDIKLYAWYSSKHACTREANYTRVLDILVILKLEYLLRYFLDLFFLFYHRSCDTLLVLFDNVHALDGLCSTWKRAH